MLTWVDMQLCICKPYLSGIYTQPYCTLVHLPRYDANTRIYRELRVHMLNGIFISVDRVKLSECNALILCPRGREESKVLQNDQKRSLKSS